MAEDRLYEVEQILGKKIVNKRRLYLVRWRGFSSEHDSWEPYSNLEACKPLIKYYNKNLEDSKNQHKIILRNDAKPVDAASDKTVTNSIQVKGNPVKKVKTCSHNVTPTVGNNSAKTVVNKKKRKKNPVPIESKVLQIKEDISINRRISLPFTNSESEASKKPSAKKKLTDNDQSVKTNASPILMNNIEPETVKKSVKQKHESKNSSSVLTNNNESEAVKKPAKRKQSDEDHSKSKTSKEKKVKHTHAKSQERGDSIHPKELRRNSDEENDDDILYSLNHDCDIMPLSGGKVKNKLNGKKHAAKEKESSLKSVIVKKNLKSDNSKEEGLRSAGAKKKSLNLIDSKKKPKDWLSKSGLLRSASPPPLFTAIKHMIVRRDSRDPSIRSNHSLPEPVSPETSETYLADVPSSYPVAAEEPVVNEDNISAGSLGYNSLLDSLPEQLHPGHKTDNTAKTESGISECSGSNGGSLFSSTLSSSFGGESVERRTSVRSTECAFRYKQIVVKKCLRYTQIWLNTQTVMHNALNPQVIQEVVSALNSAKYDDSHLVLFSSLGNVFCSGTDLHFLVSGDRKMAARQMTDAIRELTKAFITFPKPIIAAVSGAVVGLGVSLLALCDVVYASDKASFHLPYSQLSQTPEGCSSFTLPLTVGLPSANELLYGGRKITAMEAYQQGLVSQVFWPTLMMQEVIPRAQNMANSSAKALEATKLLIRSHHRTKMELTNETECNLLLERWTSSECQRAIEAYISNEKNFTF
ncbi:Chromodomain Y-like protein 2 [Bulinus truncatus]|nr:Chromodomain Y-like protein 2 [Bulinus truncatus]